MYEEWKSIKKEEEENQTVTHANEEWKDNSINSNY